MVVDDPDHGAGVSPGWRRTGCRCRPSPRRWQPAAVGGSTPPAPHRLSSHGPGVEPRAHPFVPRPHQALVPDGHRGLRAAPHRSVCVHTYFSHVRSSQAFALNMLAATHTRTRGRRSPAIISHDPDASRASPPSSSTPTRTTHSPKPPRHQPHATQVDCLVRARLGNGRMHALLIEVKLSEDNFSTCSAYTSPRNTRQTICGQPGPFGGDPSGCFQLANHDREHRRRYDEMLGQPSDEPSTFGCWFRDGANQVMRNAALAKALVARGEVASASMMLMAPDDHTAIWEQWHRHVALLSAVDDISFADLPASHVAALHEPTQARTLSERYLLPLDPLEVALRATLRRCTFPRRSSTHPAQQRRHLELRPAHGTTTRDPRRR